MSTKHLLTSLLCLPLLAHAAELNLPLLPAEAAVIEKIAAIEGIELVRAAKPGFAAKNAADALAAYGVKGPVAAFAVHDQSSEKRAITISHDQAGHILAISGNGPWLRNEAYAHLAALPELRMIRIDHNTPTPGSKGDPGLYNGAGISALENSKLVQIKIGHAFDDNGMKSLARVKSLHIAHIGHSKVTDAGVAALAGHPGLEEFSISSQGRSNRVTEKCLSALATLPKLERLGLHETFLTYHGGLKHLAALKGRLKSVSLKMTLVLPGDVEKLKADHPGLEVETSAPAEILANPNARGVQSWASPEAVAYLKSNAKP